MGDVFTACLVKTHQRQPERPAGPPKGHSWMDFELESRLPLDSGLEEVFRHASDGRPAWMSTQDPESELAAVTAQDSDGGSGLGQDDTR